MNNYELTFIIDAQLAPEKQEEIVTRFLEMLKSRNIEILNVEKWGKKKLAYAIDDKQYGYYLITQFRAPAVEIAEIEHFLKITPSIFRYLILHRNPKIQKMIQLESERLAREAARLAEKERALQAETDEFAPDLGENLNEEPEPPEDQNEGIGPIAKE